MWELLPRAPRPGGRIPPAGGEISARVRKCWQAPSCGSGCRGRRGTQARSCTWPRSDVQRSVLVEIGSVPAPGWPVPEVAAVVAKQVLVQGGRGFVAGLEEDGDHPQDKAEGLDDRAAADEAVRPHDGELGAHGPKQGVACLLGLLACEVGLLVLGCGTPAGRSGDHSQGRSSSTQRATTSTTSWFERPSLRRPAKKKRTWSRHKSLELMGLLFSLTRSMTSSTWPPFTIMPKGKDIDEQALLDEETPKPELEKEESYRRPP